MISILKSQYFYLTGGLAQLARAPALHAGGHRFDSDILHKNQPCRDAMLASPSKSRDAMLASPKQKQVLGKLRR